MMKTQFSLLMSVYSGDTPTQLNAALRSVALNTVWPDECVVVIDGPVSPALMNVLWCWQDRLPLRMLALDQNVGLGRALAYGLDQCQYEWVARFDADDLCMANRFERQLQFIAQHPQVDAFSAPILEFHHNPSSEVLALRDVPKGVQQVAAAAHWRNPFNHMAVMFKRASVLQVGGYQPLEGFEDYGLWVRMLLAGMCLDNMPYPCVYVCAGKGMVQRRSGWVYARREWHALRQFTRWHFLSTPQLLCSAAIRLPLRLLPQQALASVYRLALRR